MSWFVHSLLWYHLIRAASFTKSRTGVWRSHHLLSRVVARKAINVSRMQMNCTIFFLFVFVVCLFVVSGDFVLKLQKHVLRLYVSLAGHNSCFPFFILFLFFYILVLPKCTYPKTFLPEYTKFGSLNRQYHLLSRMLSIDW